MLLSSPFIVSLLLSKPSFSHSPLTWFLSSLFGSSVKRKPVSFDQSKGGQELGENMTSV